MTVPQFVETILAAPETVKPWEGRIEIADEMERLLPKTFVVVRDMDNKRVMIVRGPDR